MRRRAGEEVDKGKRLTKYSGDSAGDILTITRAGHNQDTKTTSKAQATKRETTSETPTMTTSKTLP